MNRSIMGCLILTRRRREHGKLRGETTENKSPKTPLYIANT